MIVYYAHMGAFIAWWYFALLAVLQKLEPDQTFAGRGLEVQTVITLDLR